MLVAYGRPSGLESSPELAFSHVMRRTRATD